MLRLLARAAAPWLCLPLLLVACSSKDTAAPGPAGAAQKPTNATWCGSVPAATNCAGRLDVCGACVGIPADALKRSTDTKEYNGSGPPDLACLTTPTSLKPLGVSKIVTLRGYVKIFANGPDSKNVKIEVFKEKLDGSKPTGRSATRSAPPRSRSTSSPTGRAPSRRRW